MKKSSKNPLQHFTAPFFFLCLFVFTLFFTATSTLALYEHQFTNKIYPGIKIGDIDVSAKTKEEIIHLFDAKNGSFAQASFTFRYKDKIATASGAELKLGYNSKLIADQAFTVGRTGNIFADMFNKGKALYETLTLSPSYSIENNRLKDILIDMANE